MNIAHFHSFERTERTVASPNCYLSSNPTSCSTWARETYVLLSPGRLYRGVPDLDSKRYSVLRERWNSSAASSRASKSEGTGPLTTLSNCVNVSPLDPECFATALSGVAYRTRGILGSAGYSIRAPFARLCLAHKSRTLLAVALDPPLAKGRSWSKCSCVVAPQITQRPRSRLNTSTLTFVGICRDCNSWSSDSGSTW